jgi:hypothetical protein
MSSEKYENSGLFLLTADLSREMAAAPISWGER